MRAYHASVLLPEMPAARAEFCCTVYASSLHKALREVGRKIEAHKGRERLKTVRVTLHIGETVKEVIAAVIREEFMGLRDGPAGD